MNLEHMYQDIILDHYKHPHGRGLQDPFDSQVHHVNPTCGDEITLRLKMDQAKKVISVISYEGQGCSISQASTSILVDLLQGLTAEESLKVLDSFQEMISSRGTIEGDENILGDAIALAGVSRYPARVKCALLGWMAFKDAFLQACQ